MLVERPGVVDVGGADADIGFGGKGAAVHAQAAVTAFVGAETLEEKHIVRHGDDRVARHQQPPQLRIMAGEIAGVVLASVPVEPAQFAKPLLQPFGHRLDLLSQRLGAYFPGHRPAKGVFALFLLRLVRLVSRLVLLLEPEIADDNIVQGADRLPEAKGLG